jgi:formylmethanofuran dehydrogenase subunit E
MKEETYFGWVVGVDDSIKTLVANSLELMRKKQKRIIDPIEVCDICGCVQDKDKLTITNEKIICRDCLH